MSKIKLLRLCIILLLCAPFLGMIGDLAGADQSLHPLQPPDRSSPRATLKTFLDDMNMAVEAYNGGHRDQVVAHVFRAIRCLDLSAEPPAIRKPLGVHAALYLKETLDRIELPPYDQIPDAQEVQTKKISSWTIPYTKALYCRRPSYKHLLINAFQSRVGKVININVSGLSLRRILLFPSILPIPRFLKTPTPTELDIHSPRIPG